MKAERYFVVLGESGVSRPAHTTRAAYRISGEIDSVAGTFQPKRAELGQSVDSDRLLANVNAITSTATGLQLFSTRTSSCISL